MAVSCKCLSLSYPGWLPALTSDQVSDGELCDRGEGAGGGAVLQGAPVPGHRAHCGPIAGDDPTERGLVTARPGVDNGVSGQ